VPRFKHLTTAQVVVLVILGLIALISLVFTLVSPFTQDEQTEGTLLYMVPFFAAPILGCVGAAAMLLLRRPSGSSNWRVGSAMVLWFFGTWLAAFSVTALFIPSDSTLLENLGFSIGLCLAPGLALTAAGLGVYWYDWQQNPAQTAVVAQDQAAPPPAGDELAGIQARAAEYRHAILQEIRQKQNAAFAGRLAGIPEQVKRWQERVDILADRLRSYAGDTLTQADLGRVPAAITGLEADLASERDPAVRAQMEDTLAGYHEHVAQLGELDSLMRRARLQLEETVTAMGALYARLQLLGAMDLDGPAARSIQEEIDAQAQSLGGLVSALSEAYAPHTPSNARSQSTDCLSC
jgi:hypothetical protein